MFFEAFQEEAKDRSGEKVKKRGREDGRKLGGEMEREHLGS